MITKILWTMLVAELTIVAAALAVMLPNAPADVPDWLKYTGGACVVLAILNIGALVVAWLWA